MQETPSDAALLSALRAGDRRAFETLWQRHYDAAYRYAYRVFPSRADDLVSDSFLAIYQQVTATGKGPEFAFRSYLKAVIRNTSIRWRKEDERVIASDDVDRVDPEDGLSIVEQEANSADVAAAFQELPERWQRVLWLAEVAEAGRPEIARELGIKPNAVSALQRRARTGLKFQWLARQIPVALREDEAHVARLIPQYLTEPRNTPLAAEVTAHLAACDRCDDLLVGMRGSATRLQRSTLAVLLGSAGISVPAASLGSGTAAAAVALSTASGIGLSGWLLAGGLTVAAGSLVVTSLFFTAPAAPPSSAPTGMTAEAAPDVPASTPPSATSLSSAPHTPAPGVSPPADDPATGRHVDDPGVDSAGLSADPDQYMPTAPVRPAVAPAGVPGPLSDPEDPGTAPADGPSPGVTSPDVSSGYIAPVIAGRAAPGDSVALELNAQRYTPTVAPDGSWAFDARALQPEAGTYTYQVWAFDEAEQSAATTGTFTVLPLAVQGFEQLTGFEDMTVDEASTTGVVIAVTGPPNGRVFITTIQGVSATIDLDQNGYTRKRLLMNTHGWYNFTFRALDADGFWGPGREAAVDVYDPDVIFDPWGTGDEDMTFQVVDP